MISLQCEGRYSLISEKLNVHVISLRRATQRNGLTEHSLRQQNLSFSTYDAIDGLSGFGDELIMKYAGPKKAKRIRVLHLHLLPSTRAGQIGPDIVQLSGESGEESLHENLRFGCYLSHVFLWQKLKDSRMPFLTILEDDVKIEPDFSKRLRALLISMPKTWDVLYLDGCFKKFGPEYAPGLILSRGGLCTHGYVITTDAATKLLEGRTLRSEVPIDHVLDQEVLSGKLVAFHAEPPLVKIVTSLHSTLAYQSHHLR